MGVQEGTYGYTNLKHLIELWPQYWGKKLGTMNEAASNKKIWIESIKREVQIFKEIYMELHLGTLFWKCVTVRKDAGFKEYYVKFPARSLKVKPKKLVGKKIY